MQRRTSQTFQRLRKLSDTLVSAIAPTSSAKSTAHDTFFEYDKKGWCNSTRTSNSAGSGSAHRRPLHQGGQRVSKEDIHYPLLPTVHSLDPESSADADARERARARARTRRPERPSEEDLPYGAQGSVPKALAPQYVAPPPAVGSRSRREPGRSRAEDMQGSVPFPGPVAGSRERDRTAHVSRAQREKPLPEPPREARPVQAIQSPPRPAAFFNAFASGAVPARDPAVRPAAPGAPTRARDVFDPHGPSGVEKLSRPERGRVDAPVPPSSHQPYARVRRISSTGDVHPAPYQARYRDENDPPHHSRARGPPELRPVRSTPLRLHENRARSPLPPPPPVPVYPATPQPLVHVAKPRPRNVPRDVSPEHNPQRLPTPRRSREEVRACQQSWQPQPQPQAGTGVAARARADLRVQQSAARRAVRVDVAPEHLRAMEYEAQVVRPARDAERQPERVRGRERRTECIERHRDPQRRAAPADAQETQKPPARERRPRPTHTRAVEVEYYGMSDAFTQEITIALAEPERAHPLPVDWRVGAPPSKDYGVRPLVTKKSRQMAGAM